MDDRNMLGELRDAADALLRDSSTIDELPRDLAKLTTTQIRDQLAEYGLLPASAGQAPTPRSIAHGLHARRKGARCMRERTWE